MFILCIFPVLAFGQETTARWEIEQKMTDTDFTAFAIGGEGMVVFRETRRYEEGDKWWEFKILDNHLEELHDLEILLDNDLNLIGYASDEDQFYMLFRKGFTATSDFALYRFSIDTGNYSRFTVKNEIDLELTHFIITGTNMVLGGFAATRPTLVHYSLTENKVDVLPGYYHKDTKLVDMVKNVNGTFNVLFLDTESVRNKSIIRLKVYSPTGEELLESSTEFDEDIRINSGTTSKLQGDDLVIMGTYGRKRNNNLSQGIYFIKVKPGVNDLAHFTEFAEFQDLWKFMGENREKRIKNKIADSTPDDPFEFRATVIIWKLVETDENYILFSELVDPNYENFNRRSTNSYRQLGIPLYNDWETSGSNRGYYSTTNSLVDKDQVVSVNYRESVMAVFDKMGRIVTDKSLVIDDIEIHMLDQISAFHSQPPNYQMMYKDRDELFTSYGDFIKNNTQDSVFIIGSIDPMEEVKNEDEDSGKVEHWFDNHYFVWGYQRIQNLVTKESRYVFYINKLTM